MRQVYPIRAGIKNRLCQTRRFLVFRQAKLTLRSKLSLRQFRKILANKKGVAFANSPGLVNGTDMRLEELCSIIFKLFLPLLNDLGLRGFGNK